jgi:hypothetical protein
MGSNIYINYILNYVILGNYIKYIYIYVWHLSTYKKSKRKMSRPCSPPSHPSSLKKVIKCGKTFLDLPLKQFIRFLFKSSRLCTQRKGMSFFLRTQRHGEEREHTALAMTGDFCHSSWFLLHQTLFVHSSFCIATHYSSNLSGKNHTGVPVVWRGL